MIYMYSKKLVDTETKSFREVIADMSVVQMLELLRTLTHESNSDSPSCESNC
jgi:hypothetical protein